MHHGQVEGDLGGGDVRRLRLVHRQPQVGVQVFLKKVTTGGQEAVAFVSKVKGSQFELPPVLKRFLDPEQASKVEVAFETHLLI